MSRAEVRILKITRLVWTKSRTHSPSSAFHLILCLRAPLTLSRRALLPSNHHHQYNKTLRRQPTSVLLFLLASFSFSKSPRTFTLMCEPTILFHQNACKLETTYELAEAAAFHSSLSTTTTSSTIHHGYIYRHRHSYEPHRSRHSYVYIPHTHTYRGMIGTGQTILYILQAAAQHVHPEARHDPPILLHRLDPSMYSSRFVRLYKRSTYR